MLHRLSRALLLGYKPAQVRKAIAGGVVSAAAAFVPALSGGITGPELGAIVGAFIIGAGAVFGIKNARA